MASLLQPGSRTRSAVISIASLIAIAIPIKLFVFPELRVMIFIFWGVIGILIWMFYAWRSGYDSRSESSESSAKRGSGIWASLRPRMLYDFLGFKVMLTVIGLTSLQLILAPNLDAPNSSFFGACLGATLYDSLRA